MSDASPWYDRTGGLDYALCVDPEMPVKVSHGPGLSEMFHPERAGAMPVHAAKPGQSRRVTVDHRHQSAS